MGFFRQNTGVGCHLLLQGIFPLGIEPASPDWQADSLPLSHLGSPLNYSPQNSPGQNTGVGSLSFSRGSPQPRDRPGLLHCRQIHYQLSHKGSPRILEWVAYPFSSRSSQPRNRWVSWVSGGFFTN